VRETLEAELQEIEDQKKAKKMLLKKSSPL
jgi:hypothetical protein